MRANNGWKNTASITPSLGQRVSRNVPGAFDSDPVAYKTRFVHNTAKGSSRIEALNGLNASPQ
jgi:hypothetical protein